MRLRPSYLFAAFALVAIAVVLALNTGAAPSRALAAVDCSVTHSLRVEVIDNDAADPGTRIDILGARVRITPDPEDGVGSRTIVDQGAFDDSPLVGRLEFEAACAGDYELVLSFNGLVGSCDIADDTLDGDNTEALETVTFDVDDCAAAPPRPTATPTATSTPTPTATPTNTPLPPTATPTQPAATFTPVPPQIIVINPAPVVVVQPTAAPASRIVPPNTGSAGLASRNVLQRIRLAAWGDEPGYCHWIWGYGWIGCWAGWP